MFIVLNSQVESYERAFQKQTHIPSCSFTKVCQVVCGLLYQKFLCFKYAKRTYVKPYEV